MRGIKMSLKQFFGYILVVLFVISYNEVLGIKCYQCSSFIDTNCGTTWGFEGMEGDMYLEECDENSVACKKLQFEESISGKMMVTRSCYNGTAVKSLVPVGCETMSLGEACYCIPDDDRKGCNGQAGLVPFYIHYLGLLSLILVLFI